MYPSIADGRDLLNFITGNDEWSPLVKIANIILKLPETVRNLFKNPIGGSFVLGNLYDITFWSSSDDYFIRKVNEIIPSTEQQIRQRILILTDNAFLLFEPDKNNCECGTLVAWGFLESLLAVELINDDTVTLQWNPKDDLKKAWKQLFEVEDGTQLVNEITNRMKKLDKVKVTEGKRTLLSEEEVTSKAVSDIDISEINNNIALCESSLESELTLSKFQTLMVLYQKVFSYDAILGN